MNDSIGYREHTYNSEQCVFIAKASRENELKVSSVLFVIAATDDGKLFKLESENDWIDTAVLIEKVIEVLRGDINGPSKECIAGWLRNAGVLV